MSIDKALARKRARLLMKRPIVAIWCYYIGVALMVLSLLAFFIQH